MIHFLRRLRNHLGYRLFIERTRRTHRIVRRKDGSPGFTLFGNPLPLSHFARYYLEGDTADVVTPLRNGTNFTRLARQAAEESGLAVVALIKPPRDLAADLLTVPRFVDVCTALPESIEEYRRRMKETALADVRRIIKFGYEYQISRDPGLVSEFYHRYHRPSISSRHWDDAHILTEAGIAEMLAAEGGEFLRVMDGDTCVAMGLNRVEGDLYTLHRLGWRDACPELHKNGVVAAIYWFGAMRAYALGLRRLTPGGAAPYLEDGLLYCKAKWGSRLDWDRTCYDTWQLLLNPAHPQCRAFLSRCSLILRGPRGKFFIVSAKAPSECSQYAAHRDSICAWFRLRGEPLAGRPASGLLPASLDPWFDSITLGEAVPAQATVRLQGEPVAAR